MTPDNYNELREYIHDIYLGLAKRPSMYAGSVEAVEAFVVALEMILNHFGDQPQRKGQYLNFRDPHQFGNETFSGAFQRVNNCTLEFLEFGDQPKIIPRDVFAKAFEEHWVAYLSSIGLASR